MASTHAWIKSLPNQIPAFLAQLSGDQGFYQYSLSGDILPSNLHWGLGNAVFAIKILSILNYPAQDPRIQAAAAYIKTFNQQGFYSDNYVRALSTPMRLASSVVRSSIHNFSYTPTRRAETRQSLNALHLAGMHAHYPSSEIPQSAEQIQQYLQALDWNFPWAAGAHFSHLCFMLHHSGFANRHQLIEDCCEFISQLQNADGAWYQGSPSAQQKINGAMKIITGLHVINKLHIDRPEALIDLCLQSTNDQQACDHFNILYVLRHTSALLKHRYRFDEIQKFVNHRISLYKEYYYPRHGGFSFYKGAANRLYYGAPITWGKAEPDIHGTLLFLWGISVAGQLIKLPITLIEHHP